jgi:hypothetical protein
MRVVIALSLAVGVGVFAFMRPHVSDAPFGYDEADYAYAASHGVLANALDEPSIGLVAFVREGLRLSQDDRSRFIRRSGDLPFYRHYHGPLFVYGITGRDERGARLFSAACAALAVAIVAVFAGAPAAALAAAAVVFGPLLVETGLLAQPHALYVAVVALALGALGRFLVSGVRGWWLLAAGATGIGLATLEYGCLLVVTLAVCVLPSPNRKARLTEAALVIAATVVTVWPASLLRLTIVQNWLVYAYVALVTPHIYGDTPIWRTWLARLLVAPALLVGFWALVARGRLVAARPAAVYAVLILLANAGNHSPNATYVASLLPALGLLVGTMRWRWPLAGGLALLTLVTTWRALPDTLAIAATFHGHEDTLATVMASPPPTDGCRHVPWRLVPAVSYYSGGCAVRFSTSP